MSTDTWHPESPSPAQRFVNRSAWELNLDVRIFPSISGLPVSGDLTTINKK